MSLDNFKSFLPQSLAPQTSEHYAGNVTKLKPEVPEGLALMKLSYLQDFVQAPLKTCMLTTRFLLDISRTALKEVSRNLGLLLAIALLLWLGSPQAAYAGLNDDHYDGNIFPLYAGNGSLVPPKVSLAEALKRDKPTFLFYYLDDSSDCKAYSSVVSQLDAFYGRAADFIPVDIDSIPPKSTYIPEETGFYYNGLVPQVVLLDQSGTVVLDQVGQVPFETIDDEFRILFDLLPRSESVELKRRQVNEINVELRPES
jgi:hypothetical protein